MYTNKGLVIHAKNALAKKTKYMWGGILRPITADYVNALAKYYPEQYSSTRMEMLKQLPCGYFGVDCVGLVKSYYWSGKANGGTGSPKYSPKSDVNAGGMYSAATEKGKIETLPEIPGIVLYCRTNPHIGIYIGNGEVIESTYSRRGDGVIKTKLKDFKWEYWLKCPFIEYEAEPIMKGDRVRVKSGAATYDGKKLASFVYSGIYEVMEVKNDRAVIGINGQVTAAVKVRDIEKIW